VTTDTLPHRLAVIARAVSVVTLPALAVGVLHGLSDHPWAEIVWSDLPVWLRGSRSEDVIAALARIVGLAASYWLLLVTIVAVISCLHEAGWADALARRMTPASIRHLVERSLVATATAGVLATGVAGTAVPVVAATSEPLEVVAPPPPGVAPPVPTDATGLEEEEEEEEEEGDPRGGAGSLADDEVDTGGGGRAEEAAESERVADKDVHTVVAGEHLWGIARDHLGAAHGVSSAEVPAGDVVPYWREVIAANRARIRSGDPDLIFPGERILLPPREQDTETGGPG
jgi:hypothetical protein